VGARGALVAAALLAAGCGGGETSEQALPAAPDTLEFSTPAFKDGGAIPAANTCDGAGKPPTLVWRALPAGSVELVLVVEDPDAPKGTFTHWTAYGIPAATGGGLAPDGRWPTGTRYGENSAGEQGWTPPCPPEGDSPHHYTFALYALKQATGLQEGAAPDAVRAKLAGALGRGTFSGTYRRR
jgi:Raf kinase inhibitor-like YbhB/YbcL family protein